MKRVTQILFFGLLLSISSMALADKGHGRNGNEGYYGDRGQHSHQYDRNDRRHYVRNDRHARRHLHNGRYCYDWHPRGYVAPRVRYAYNTPGLVIVYEPRAGLYIAGGR